MKHKQPCVTPPNELVAALTKSPMYCCAEWSELDPISQAQHKLGDTQEWRDYKEHCDYTVAFFMTPINISYGVNSKRKK